MRRKWFYKIPGIILVVIAAVAVFGAVVERLWNWLIPGIVGWHAINFWQAIGILLLSKILFGGFRGRGGMHWRHRMAERWEKMSPEEREKFSRGMHERCGHRPWQPEEQKI
jgi:Ca2+/H+ antiporter, TMEM165/GDT1 family